MTEYSGGIPSAFKNWILFNSCPFSYQVFIYNHKYSNKRKNKESLKPLPKLKACH